MKKKLRVATRGSLLASTQTKQTVEQVRVKNPDREFEVITFKTTGDKVTDRPLTQFGGTGIFVKELENALLENRADFAVHSLKDVPSFQPEGLVLAAFPQRENPADLFLTRDGSTLKTIKQDFVLGTGSPRRRVQIAGTRPDVVFRELRGNLDTRIKKLHKGEYDAIVVAAAGMNRLGYPYSETSILPVETCIPAIGQGAIAIECRKDDPETLAAVQKIDDPDTKASVLAERAFMKEIEGGCKFPMAAFGRIENRKLVLTAMAGELDKNEFIVLTETAEPSDGEALGIQMAKEVKERCKQRKIVLHY